MEFNELIAQLKKLLERLANKQDMVLFEIEDITFNVISNDNFDELSDDVQDAIYLLNNYEFEKPTDLQVDESVEIIRKYVSSNQSITD